MTDRLDTLLESLREAPAGRDLSRLESAVRARIERERKADLFGGRAFPVQIAAACGALLLGLAMSHLTAISPMAQRLSSEIVVLSDDASLAPSVLLEGGI